MHQKAIAVGSTEPNGKGTAATTAKRMIEEIRFVAVVWALVTLQPAYSQQED